MYRLDNDIPPFINSLTEHMSNLNIKYDVKRIIVDITYFKSFNSNYIIEVLGLTMIKYKKDVEQIFVDVCLSVILSNTTTNDSKSITIKIIELLEEIVERRKLILPPLFNKAFLVDKLLLYVDVLRNNIEHTLSTYGLNTMTRVCEDNIEDAHMYEKIYSIVDFTSVGVFTNSSKHSICIDVYDRGKK